MAAPFQAIPQMYQAPPLQMSNLPVSPMNFPPFHINESDYNSGSIVMKAKSPSGANKVLNLQRDKTGQFTTNFVPSEIGDWQISILCNCRHIKGSPFVVRVYDPTKVKVFGLEGGDCGKPVHFTIDASMAGAGKLKVEVTKDGRPIECKLVPKSGSAYECMFNPKGPGFYKVRVFFATMEVQGSPFGVKIVDTQNISVIGDGVSCCLVKHKTSFLVNTAKAGLAGDVVVNIHAPSGSPVPPKATVVGAGTYLIEYTPCEIGNYKIDVQYEGRQICKGPFTCKVFGTNECKVTHKPKDILICRPCCVDFVCPNSGSGEPEVFVNAGRVPVEVTSLGDRKYRACFVPPRVGEYCVQVMMYGDEITDGLFKVRCFDASRMTTTLDNVKAIVAQPISFNVCTKPFDGELEVTVLSPTKKTINCKIDKINEFNYKCEFTPHEIGAYNVVALFEGLHVYGSPFIVHVANPKGVLVSMKCKSVALGQPFHLTADTSRAGPGELVLRANNADGPIPVQAKCSRFGYYDVNFVSSTPGDCYLEVLFDGIPHDESPIALNVFDVRHVNVSSGHNLVKSGQTRVITINTDGCAQLAAKMSCGSQRNMPLTITGTVATGFEATLTPTEPGPYQVDITYGCVPVPCCPIRYMCYDPAKVRVLSVGNGIVCQKSTFMIDLNECGEGELEVIILSSTSNKPILNEVTPLQPGKLQVCYTPFEGGPHYAEVSFNKEPVTGSPFHFKVHDLNKMTVRGDGIDCVQAGDSALFYISAQDTKADDFEVYIKGPPGCRQIMPLLTDVGNNQVKVEYLPKMAGDYWVHINYHNIPIANSPFQVKVWDASKVNISKLCQGQVGVESSFNVTLKEAGDGTVEISVLDSCGQLIPNCVTSVNPGCLMVTYTPQSAGEHQAIVEFNEVKIPGVPMKFNVIDPSKVNARGEGLGLVECRHPAVFYVSANDAKLKDFFVKITGPNQSELNTNITENSNGLKVEYTPTVVGPYQIHVNYCGIAVSGSPFVARAWDASRVMLTAIAMGQVATRSNFKVIVSDAGEGVCEMSVTDPSGQLVANQAVPDMDGAIDVSFIPSAIGIHKGTVLFNKHKVPGSPFTFMVIDKSRISCCGEGVGFVPVKRPTTFAINAPMACLQDIEAKIIGPREIDVPLKLSDSGNNSFKVDYTPTTSGDYQIAVRYFGNPVFVGVAKAWDISRILVGNLKVGKVGHESTFTVDVREAGEGRLEISIVDSNGKNVENSVSVANKTAGLFVVSCVPRVCGEHNVAVHFNDEDANGSPFTFSVCDPHQAHVVGDGIGYVRCGKPTSFDINGPAALLQDLHVHIKDMNGKQVKSKISAVPKAKGQFQVEYTPSIPGLYSISVNYFDECIAGSPFTATAWNSQLVKVDGLRSGITGRPNSFIVMAGQAGPGNLEIKVVTESGELVGNTARGLDNGDVEVTFVPVCRENHRIHINFNDEPIPGSPFTCSIINGALAKANGPAFGRVRAGQPTRFHIDCKPVGCHGEIELAITAPCGAAVPAMMTGCYASGFDVEFAPMESGTYTIDVKCAESIINGSPFKCEVFDPCEVSIKQIPLACVNRVVSINADASRAGPGRLSVSIQGHKTRPFVEVLPDSNQNYLINFTPTEGGQHSVVAKYNDFDIPGSPFLVNVIDHSLLKVKCDTMMIIGSPVTINLDTTTSPECPIDCQVRDPNGNPVEFSVMRKGTNSHFTYVPQTVGAFETCLRYADEEVAGGPFICNVYSPHNVKLVEVTTPGNVGQEVSFTVDASQAGVGTLDVIVTCGSRHVPLRHETCMDSHIFTFVPKSCNDHIINIYFNKILINVCPIAYEINNPSADMVLSSSCKECMPVGHIVTALVTPPQKFVLSPTEITAKVTPPAGTHNIIPVKVSAAPCGGVKIEYSANNVGPHGLIVSYASHVIPGSPLITDIHDPNKVIIEGVKQGDVHSNMSLNIVMAEAGMAHVACTVLDPQGEAVPFEIDPTPVGQVITYTPNTSGIYKVNVTYGGLNVPGCPIRQEIRGSGPVKVTGEGLYSGVVNIASTFIVDTHGRHGELAVNIDGPGGPVHADLSPKGKGLCEVSYTPQEIGIHNISLAFNNSEIPGTYMAKVVDPRQVMLIDRPSDWLDHDHCRVPFNQLKTFAFSTVNAGPGKFSCEVESPEQIKVCADIVPVDDGFLVKFIPRLEGNYIVRVLFNGVPIPRYPIIAIVEKQKSLESETDIKLPIRHHHELQRSQPSQQPNPIMVFGIDRGYELPQQQEHEPTGPCTCIDENKVVLSGPGLSDVKCKEQTCFVIDGKEAGSGTPSVIMVGVKCDINVHIEEVDENLYGCSYTPEFPGAYLLTIRWSGKQLPNSPIKITALPCCDAYQVICHGDSLKSASLGQETSVVVDCRRAGQGKLKANLESSEKSVRCEIEDRGNGIFEIHFIPVSIGLHMLHVKFDEEPVRGSPFTVKVMGMADASKVKAHGDGLKHGILATFDSKFVVDTKGAGPGQLNVKVKGKKGTFRVEMKRDDTMDRRIVCAFNPTEIGEYFVNVLWSNEHVPGSPFRVKIVDTIQELADLKCLALQSSGPEMDKYATMNSNRGLEDFTFYEE